MIGDVDEPVSHIVKRLEAVELGGLDQRIRRGDAIAAGIGAGEEVVLPAVEDKR